MKFFRQCRLEWDKKKTVSWIPADIAKVDQLIKVKDKNGDWKLWFVRSAGPRQDEETIKCLERQYKWTRPHSDI